MQVGHGERVAAAEAGKDGFVGQSVRLALAVQGFAEAADRIGGVRRGRAAGPGSGVAASIGGRRRFQDRPCGGGVPRADFFRRSALVSSVMITPRCLARRSSD